MRARNIKPSFFTNDVLAECEPLARLLFAGLWTIADREGRLEDRPKKIKAEVLPYDVCDCELLLHALTEYGFISRYVVGENKFIQILNFVKHQNPHVKEAPSTIPAPDKHQTSTVQNVPYTDSPILIPDSPIPHTSTRKPGKIPAAVAALPDWMPIEPWESWVSMRKKIPRSPFTPEARALAIGKLERFRAQGHDPTELLNAATLNAWKSFFIPKENQNGNTNGNRNAGTGNGTQPGELGKPKSSWSTEADRLREKYTKQAQLEREAEIVECAGKDLRVTETIRKNIGAT